jgi:hypothetical protein
VIRLGGILFLIHSSCGHLQRGNHFLFSASLKVLLINDLRYFDTPLRQLHFYIIAYFKSKVSKVFASYAYDRVP